MQNVFNISQTGNTDLVYQTPTAVQPVQLFQTSETAPVFQKDGIAYTDTLRVARYFEKRHADVLRAIENLDCSTKFRQRNFALSSYLSEQNKELPKVDMTRDGFSFLVMGFTGKDAAYFKEKFIESFNWLEDKLKQQVTQTSVFNPDSLTKMDILKMAIESEQQKILLEQQNRELEEKKILLESSVKTMTPAYEYCNDVRDTTDLSTMQEVAKNLNYEGVGPNQLFEILRKQGILKGGKGKEKNQPYAQHKDKFVLRENTYTDHNDKVHITYRTYVTMRGKAYINKLLKKLGYKQNWKQ